MSKKNDLQSFCTDDEVINENLVPKNMEKEETEADEANEIVGGSTNNRAFVNDTQNEIDNNAPNHYETEIDDRTDEGSTDGDSEPNTDKNPETDKNFVVQSDFEEDNDNSTLSAAINVVISLISSQNGEIKKQIEETNDKLTQLTAQVSAGNRAITAHENIENNLNNELQKYKNDFYTKLVSPYINQLISLYTEMKEDYESICLDFSSDNADEETPKVVKQCINTMEYYVKTIQGALSNFGVEIITPKPGDPYDYIAHRITKTVSTDDEQKKELIESVKSSTFMYNGKVLQPAKVVVYKIIKKTEE